MERRNQGTKLASKTLGVLLVFALAVAAFCVMPLTAFGAAGDKPEIDKQIRANDDGTFKLELAVTGDSDTKVETAANVNVVIVYDVSQSMTNRTGSSWWSPTRADNAEAIVYDFIDDLKKYQNTDDPSNIEVSLVIFGPQAKIQQGWTSDLTNGRNGVNRFFDSDPDDGRTDPAGVFGYSGNLGTNWDYALQRAQSLLTTLDERGDKDPTFVILVTDGVCTKSGTGSGNGDNPSDANWTHYRNYYAAAATQAYAIEGRANTSLFGIYAFGTEHDLLDDLVYYANNGEHREMTVGGTTYDVMEVPSRQYETFNFGETEATDGYYNASDADQLTQAIEDIFQTIVKALGISSVVINDGTTSDVQVEGGEISHLLAVDESSYQYWLSIPVVNNQFKRVDLVSGEEVTYTVTDNHDGTCTVTWDSKSVTVDGSVSGGDFKYEWKEANDLYNYDPPTAKFENSAVKWDLSGENGVGTLLNGVTYSVTFDVYPTQTTLDIVADIENDPGENGAWADLDPAIQEYITVDGKLSTNTTATLAYDDTRTPGAEDPLTFDNPDPVESQAVELLTVSKKWENILDGQSAKPVTLKVTSDGNDKYTVSLSNDNEWTDNVYISIGIMRTTGEGEEEQVELLAPGHDFTFTEPEELTYHWELDVPTVRPMMIDGEVTMLIKVDENHSAGTAKTYTIDGQEYYVGSTGTAALTATNHRRSSLNLTKAVTGGETPADAEFPFTLNVKNSGEASGSPSDLNSDYYIWFSVKRDGEKVDVVTSGATKEIGDDGNWTGYYYAASSADVALKLRAGDSLSIRNLPTGTTYTFTEGDLATGWNFVSSTMKVTDGEGTDSTFHGARTTTGTIESTNTEYTVTYTNKYAVTDVTVTKIWDDLNDLDKIRPSDLALTLKADGETITGATPEITKDGDNWTYTWSNLPANKGEGEGITPITYTVAEESVPTGYTVSGSPASSNGTITNKHEPEVRNIPVEKSWVGSIPEGVEVTVKLYANDEPTDKTVKLNAENQWKDEFKNLPVKVDGKVVSYSVVEDSVTGVDKSAYIVTVGGSATDGYTITNVEKTSVTVTKVWDDGSNRDAKRPESLALTLKADGQIITGATPEITKDGDSWTYTWSGLPKYDASSSSNEPIAYTVTEENVPTGYTVSGSPASNNGTITNTHETEKTSITVTKKWEDSGNHDGKRPGDLTLTLNGLPEGATAPTPTVAKDGDSWTYTWGGLPKYSNGTEIAYTVSEESVPTGYSVTGSPAGNNGTITNTHDLEKTSVTVKKVWEDNNNQDNLRPQKLMVKLLANGEDTGKSVELTATTSPAWEATISNLPKYADGGSEISYTWDEGTVTGYTLGEPSVSGTTTTLTNTHTPEKTSVTVTKAWSDSDNQDGKRPGNVSVILKAGDTQVGNAVTLEGPDWTYTWGELDKYANGQLIAYSVDEPTVPTGYTKTIADPTEDNPSFTITNAHTPETVVVEVEKKWDDADNQDGKRPGSIIVNLLANDEKVESVTITADDGWKYTWDSLPRYKAVGQEIIYTVTEEEVDYYTTEITQQESGSDDGSADGEGNGNEGSTDNPDDVGDGNGDADAADGEGDGSGDDAGDNGSGTGNEGGTTGDTPISTGYLIVNTHTPEKTSITVTKTWNDNEDQDGKRPGNITVNLLANGEQIKSATITESDNGSWTYTFEDLPVYKAGKAIKYTITENEVTNYQTVINDFNITNTHEPEKVNISVKKVWDDANNRDGIRPDNVTINLEKDGSIAESVELNAGNSWSYTWKDLPKYENKKEITYTLSEDEVSGYRTEKAIVDGVYTFTNIHQAKPDRVSSDPPVQKIVEGKPDTDETFTFQMKALTEGAPMPEGSSGGVKTIQITGSNSYEFGNMYYEKAGMWKYEITEVKGNVEGYTYDTTAYTLTVTVTEEKVGNQIKLSKTETIEGGNGTIVFTNKYEKVVPPNNSGGTPTTGDMLPMLGIGLVACAALAIATVAFMRMRRRNKLTK